MRRCSCEATEGCVLGQGRVLDSICELPHNGKESTLGKFHITFTEMSEGVLTSVLQDQIKFQNNPGKQGSLLHPSQTEDSLKRQLQCWRDPSKGRNSTKEQEVRGKAVVTWQYWLVAIKLQWEKATIAPSHT